MKIVQINVKDFEKNIQKDLHTVFTQLTLAELAKYRLSPTSILTQKFLQGSLVLNASDEQMNFVEQLAERMVELINSFGIHNGYFDEFTQEQRITVVLMLKNPDKRDKKQLLYYTSMLKLLDKKVYPPLSIQRDLVETCYKKENAEKEQTTKEEVIEEVKEEQPKITDAQSFIIQEQQKKLIAENNLNTAKLLVNTAVQTNGLVARMSAEELASELASKSWIWTKITTANENALFYNEVLNVAESLYSIGIHSSDMLKDLMFNCRQYIYYIGTLNFCRIAMADEVQNMGKIKNIHSKPVQFSDTFLNYLSSCLLALLKAPYVYQLRDIYETLMNENHKIPVELRLKNIYKLGNLNTLTLAAVENLWLTFVIENKDIISNILNEVSSRIIELRAVWDKARNPIIYPKNKDELREYYNNSNIEAIMLESILAIEAEMFDVKNMLITVKSYGIKSDYDKVAYNIASKALRYDRLSLTEKQMKSVIKQYERIEREKQLVNNGTTSCGLNIAYILLEKYDDKVSNIIKDIATTVIERKVCTQKQLTVLNDALNNITKLEQNSESIVNNTLPSNTSQSEFMFNLDNITQVENPKPVSLSTGDIPNLKEYIKEAKEKVYENAYKEAFSSNSNTNFDNFWDD